MHERQRQRGMTMIGWMLVLGLASFLVIGVFQLFPVYMNSQTINGVMNSVTQGADSTQEQAVRRSLARQFNVNTVREVSVDDFEIVEDGGNTYLVVEYEHRVNYLGNIDLIVSFEKESRFRAQ